jgi:hypothetical protein
MSPSRHHRVVSALGYGAALLVLLAVFSAYLQPDFLVTLANQVWVCF